MLFSPITSSSFPVISTLASSISGKVNIFKLSTSIPTVPQSYSKISFENSGDSLAFSTIKFSRYELDLSGSADLVTTIVYVFFVPFSAVTVIYTLLSPSFRFVFPDTTTLAPECSALAVTLILSTFSPTLKVYVVLFLLKLGVNPS